LERSGSSEIIAVSAIKARDQLDGSLGERKPKPVQSRREAVSVFGSLARETIGKEKAPGSPGAAINEPVPTGSN